MEIRRSEKLGELVGALAKAKLKFKPIIKGTENPFFKSKYADMSTLIEATEKPLAEEGLVVTQFIEDSGAKASVSTMLLHVSDQFIATELSLTMAKPDAQGFGSASTYGKRYAYQAILCIAGDEDDDGNAAVGKPVDKPAHPKPPTVKTNGAATKDDPQTSFAKNFWAAARKSGKNELEIRNFIGALGYEHTSEIPASRYSEAIEWAQN